MYPAERLNASASVIRRAADDEFVNGRDNTTAATYDRVCVSLFSVATANKIVTHSHLFSALTLEVRMPFLTWAISRTSFFLPPIIPDAMH